MYKNDTIVAISTPLGDGGIGIVRLSGNDSINIINNIFKFKNKSNNLDSVKSHTLNYGHIIEPFTENYIDEVLLSVMKSPKSYTREDVVEINSHGGILVLRKILDLVIKFGARPAEPGEFTKRAFLNGRIDLPQAEAVMDIIRAKTDRALTIAGNQLEGRFSSGIRKIYDRLAHVLAHMEADIDYPEDDISPVDLSFLYKNVKEIMSDIKYLIETSEYGKIFREGVKIGITGRPNVGKSSLLNALLKENRAIVTDIPGTTRDTIEEYLNLGGIPVNIIDTAGIRHTIDPVEEIGVKRTYDIISRADIILYILDNSSEFTSIDYEVIKNIPAKKLILIVNKTDLEKKLVIPPDLAFSSYGEISLLSSDGIKIVEDIIKKVIYDGKIQITDGIMISNVRHKKALTDCYDSLNEFSLSYDNKSPSDILAIDLKNALNHIGEILGFTVTEDIIDRIFENFCVGK